MKKNTKKTLNEFINHQIIKFALPNNNKTRKKIRAKLIRTLNNPKNNSYFKNHNIWSTAETKTINGAKTKLLNITDLNKLAQETQNYFENLALKSGGLSRKEFKKLKEEHIQNYNLAITDKQGYNYKTDDKQNLENMYKHYSQEIMLKAIFEHFYTPLNKEKIQHDLETIYYSNEPLSFSTDPTILSANNRLNHPEHNYYQPKSQK